MAVSIIATEIAIYVRERRRLEQWLANWLPTEQAEDLAGSVVADWFYQASQGLPTQYGAYYQLYMLAEPRCRRLTERQGRAMLLGARDSVQVPDGDELAEVARSYAVTYLASRLVELSWMDRKLIGASIRDHRLTSHSIDDLGATLAGQGSTNQLFSQLLRALYAHAFQPGELTEAARQVWEHEDVRSQYWARNRLKDARKARHGQSQQDHDSHHPWTPV